MSQLMFGSFTTVLSRRISFCKTCLRALRECRLIRRHVDRQAGVFHSTASVVNSSRSVLWAVGGTWAPHAVQTRGVWMPWTKRYRAADTFHWHIQTNSHACTGSLKDQNVQCFCSLLSYSPSLLTAVFCCINKVENEYQIMLIKHQWSKCTLY